MATNPTDDVYQKDVLLRFICPWSPESKFECDLYRSVTKRPRCPFFHKHSDLVFNRSIKRHRVRAEQWSRQNLVLVPKFEGAIVEELVTDNKVRLDAVFCLENLEGQCSKRTFTEDGQLYCSAGRWHPTVPQLTMLSARPNANQPTVHKVNPGGVDGAASGTGSPTVSIPSLVHREANSGSGQSSSAQKPSDSVLSLGVISSSSALYSYPSSTPMPNSTRKSTFSSATSCDTLKLASDGTLPEEPVSLPSPSHLSRLAAQLQQQDAPGWYDGAIECVQAHPFLTGCSTLTVLGAIFLLVCAALGLFGRTR